MTITSHTLVKNEARFVWFAVMGVIDYVDEMLLWDTGSTDGTKEIIKAIKDRFPSKVKTEFADNITVDNFTDYRQKMLDMTTSDWLLVVDGDEIWFDNSIKKLVEEINANGDSLESLVVPTINLVGDIYHYQEKAAGRYNLAGKKGNFALRAINRNIPGLSSSNPHGTWGWIDQSGKMVQDRSRDKIKFIDVPYIHASFLQRSADAKGDAEVVKRSRKRKYEIGHSFPLDYYYPEVFFREKPDFVSSPWEVMSDEFKKSATLQTPFRKIKRRIFPSGVGY